ncbi:amidase family protein [Candidatus Methanomassiliicoccus intestinalis]|uniref:amidase family protein n=1 Tax=Candidatus Methanomassiliicoccus intestinalis TaxID=1406512 RepID=UPI0037DC69BC
MKLAEYLTIADRHEVFAERLAEVATDDYRFHFSAKDNLCSTEFQARAGSKILDGYRPPFDATAVKKMRDEGGLLIGKTNMDEFGFGTFSVNSAYGVPKNPFDPERSCGGSSGGAAAAACLLPGHVALGVSTGGSIACPASFCGVVGFTPTYGRVSRYGLIDYGNSLDKVGILSRTAADVRQFLPAISGKDERDPTSCAQPALDMSGKVAEVAVPAELTQNLSPEVEKCFNEALQKLADLGIKVRRLSMPSLKYAISAYYILATSEASTNLARYCGMRFGVRNEDFDKSFNEFFAKTRSADFGEEAKRRVLLGTFSRMVGFRNKYYMKALQVRQLIISEYNKIFAECDAVVSPTMPFLPKRFDEIAAMAPLEIYQADFLTVPPNLTGMPHVSVPCGYHQGLPIGLQAVAAQWQEGKLVEFAENWEANSEYIFPEVSL